MFLLKKKYLYLNLILSLIVILSLGIISYFRFLEMNQNNLYEIKFLAENILFYAILFSIIQICFFIYFRLHSRNIYKKLDKTLDLIKAQNFDIEFFLKKQGYLGNKINSIISEFTKFNRLLSLKIRSISMINLLLLNNIHLNIIISDSQGKISDCSSQLLKSYNIDLNLLYGNPINKILDEKNISEILLELKKTHNMYIVKNLKWIFEDKEVITDTTFYPIYNSHQDLSNIVCFLAKESEIKTSYQNKIQLMKQNKNLFEKVANIFKIKKK